MAKQFAMVFPGQGSQSQGMLAELENNFPTIVDVFASASDVLGYDLWDLVQNNPEDKLNQTEYTQPALLAADIALWQCWQAKATVKPSIVAGHSLGEYAALVCSNVIAFDDAIQLVANRGRYMQEAVEEGEGAMAAIIGLDDEAVIAICDAASEEQIVSPANYNSIGQTVVAGHKTAVERVILLAKEKGAKLAKMIPVSVPSHCQLMQPAADRLAKDLSAISFSAPQIPVLHNIDVKAHDDIDEIKKALTAQLTLPVRWVETIQQMSNSGMHYFIECGPGKVLAGLNKRITRSIPTHMMITILKENVECH